MKIEPLLVAIGLLGPSWGCGGWPGRPTLILQVATDDALAGKVDDAVEKAREQAAEKGITLETVKRTESTSFVVEGVESARWKDLRDALQSRFGQGWQIADDATGRFVVHIDETTAQAIREDTLKEAVRVLERRVSELGWSRLFGSPVTVGHSGVADQVSVRLPRAVDVELAKRHLTTRALLELKLVEDSAPSRESVLRGEGVPPGLEIRPGPGDGPGQTIFYLVRREALITGREVRSARSHRDVNNQPEVQLALTSSGAEKFEQATRANVGRRVAIILDGTVVSAPTITGPIGAHAVISGRFTDEEASELAKVLRAGALPVRVTCLQVVMS